MKRNLKALGLALVAAFAMSVVAASAAQAQQAQFTAEKYPVAITGEEKGGPTENFFQITDSNRTHCEDVTYEATLEKASTTLTVTPHYTECTATAAIDQPSQVDLNGCHYEFEAGTSTSTEDAHGSVKIVCPENRRIEVTIGANGTVCAVDIPPQTIEGGVTFTNLENGHVTVDVAIENKITYQETDRSIFCPFENGHELTHDGDFFSTVTVSGYEDLGTHHWLTKEGHPTVEEFTKETLTEGNPLDIHVKPVVE